MCAMREDVRWWTWGRPSAWLGWQRVSLIPSLEFLGPHCLDFNSLSSFFLFFQELLCSLIWCNLWFRAKPPAHLFNCNIRQMQDELEDEWVCNTCTATPVRRSLPIIVLLQDSCMRLLSGRQTDTAGGWHQRQISRNQHSTDSMRIWFTSDSWMSVAEKRYL
jgi:hypothetical protein